MIENNTIPDTMIEFMTKEWNLALPKLLLSVTGGAIYDEFSINTIRTFYNVIYSTVKSTDTWIVSGGTNAGVMRLVGDAVKDAYYKYNKNLTVIGIATWGVVDKEPFEKVLF